MNTKAVLLIASLLLANLLGYSQSWKQINHKLDSKNGFKEFKLGSHVDSYKSQVKVLSDKDDVTICRYEGTKNKSLFGYRINSIFLFFTKKQLYKIEVAFEGSKSNKGLNNVTKYTSICIDLKKVFGKPYDPHLALVGKRSEYPPSAKILNIDQSLNWKGENVELKISHDRYISLQYNICAKMVIESISLVKSVKMNNNKRLEDDF